jgi:CheY-like chemotaxis protein
MVVENNRLLRTLYAASLSGYGYEVREAKSLKQAKSLMENGHVPDVLVIDSELFDGRSEALIRYVRQEMKRADISIVVTADKRATQENLIDKGANALVNKPVNIPGLFKEVARWKSPSVR